jgi:hypothetical protein
MEGHLIVFLSLLAGTNTMEFTKVLVFPGIITVELRPCSMTLFVSCLDACLYKIEEWKWKLTPRGLLQLEWRYCWPFVSLLIYSIQEGRMETGEGLMKGAHWNSEVCLPKLLCLLPVVVCSFLMSKAVVARYSAAVLGYKRVFTNKHADHSDLMAPLPLSSSVHWMFDAVGSEFSELFILHNCSCSDFGFLRVKVVTGLLLTDLDAHRSLWS